MKKYCTYLAIVALLLGLVGSFSTQSFALLPPGPATPTVDGVTDGVKASDEVSAKALNVTAGICSTEDEETRKGLTQRIQEALQSFLEKLREKAKEALSFRKKKDDPVIAETMKIEECTIADITNEQSVAKAFKELFTTYPVDILKKYPYNSEMVKTAYRKKAVEFSNDVMLEAYIVSRALEKRMEELQKDFKTLSKCYVDGQVDESNACQVAADTDDEIGVWGNYYRLNTIYDSLLRIVEELTALEAEWHAAQSVRVGIDPIIPDDSAASEESEPEQLSFSVKTVEKLAFAQLWTTEPETEDTVTSDNAPDKEAALEALKSSLVLTDMPKKKVYSPFEGTDKQFEDNERISKLYGDLSHTQAVHNVKVKMPTYRQMFISVRRMKELHEITIQKLLESEQSSIDYLDNFYDDAPRVWYGNGCSLNQEDRTVVCETSETLNSDTAQKLTDGGYVLCDPKNKRLCTSSSVIDYESRAGFSGWLLSSYQRLKSEMALELTEEDFSTFQQEDTEDLDMEKLKETQLAQYKAGVADSGFKRPSDEEPFEQDSRDEDLLGWHISAEASKSISEDMRAAALSWGDVEGHTTDKIRWGSIKQPYPLWADEEYYYLDYIEEKYQNIKSYLRTMDLRDVATQIADTLIESYEPDSDSDLTEEEVEEIIDYGHTVYENIRGSLVKTDPYEEIRGSENKKGLKEKLEEAFGQLQKVFVEFKSDLAALKNAKRDVYKKLDVENALLDDQKTQYNKALEEKNSANTNIAGQDMFINMEKERLEIDENAIDGFPPVAEEEKVAAQQEVVKQQAIADSLIEKMEETRERIDALRAEIEKINQQIEELKINYVKKRALWYEAWHPFEPTIVGVMHAINLIENGTTAPTLSEGDTVSAALDAVSSSVEEAQGVAAAYVYQADSLVEQGRAYALARVEEALKKYRDMGGRHGDLYDIKFAPEVLKIHTDMINDILNPELEGGFGSLVGNAIRAETCAKASCFTHDTQNLADLPPSPADFVAPRKIVYSYTPPLREIVHFDTDDYLNVVKEDEIHAFPHMSLSDYGEELPGIWNLILYGKGYVEIPVDVNKMLRTLNENNEVPPLKDADKPCVYSELAVVADTTRSVLTFSNRMKEIYKYFDDLEKSGAAEEHDELGRLYENALLTRNQFGDFLKYVEIEKHYRKALEEVDVDIKKARETITEALKIINYVPPADFDLADDGTYNEIVSRLESAKNDSLKEIIPQVKDLTPANEVLKESIEKLQNIVGALQMDNEEVVILSDNMKADSKLAEKIKAKEADNATVERYGEEEKKGVEAEKRNFGTPFHAGVCF